MRSRRQITAALLAAVLPAPVWALNPITKVVTQAEAPLQIVRYQAEYKSGTGRYEREGIYHAVDHHNVSGKIIHAVKFGFVSFNARSGRPTSRQ